MCSLIAVDTQQYIPEVVGYPIWTSKLVCELCENIDSIAILKMALELHRNLHAFIMTLDI